MKSTVRGGWARSFSVATLSVLSLFGCAQIIGLDEYTVAKPGGSAGNAGSAGSAGSAGKSGESAAAASVTSNGEGGEAGLVSEPTPVLGCDGVTPFVPNAQIVQSCIVRAGCNPNAVPLRNISTCVTYNTQQALPGERCTLKAKTCAEYQACEHLGIAQDDLCGPTQTTRCEGNLAVNCGNYPTSQFFDCDALGGTCATYDYQGTTYADCKLDIAPDSCAGMSDDTKFLCHSAAGEDDLRYYCWQNEAYGSSCSSVAHCDIDTATSNATCFYNLPACSKVGATCEGDVDNVCSDSSLFQYDCGAMGLSCSVTGRSDYCLAPGCKPADVDTNCTESCSADGKRLTLCYGGAPYTVSCADYGFSTCVTGVDDNQLPYAACRL